MADDDKMKVEKVRTLLNKAIPLQFRSAAMFTWAAGAATGIEGQALGTEFEQFGRLELEDARRLIEKLVALGGEPTTDVAGFESFKANKTGIRKLMDAEEETLEALHAVIPETGQEPRSEALEHLMEHMLMRKQEQVDFLERVRLGL
jgi:bacterioferritin (cytochrome b1)